MQSKTLAMATATSALLIVAVLLVSGSVVMAATESESSRTNDIKAVFIYKFTGYVTWPDDEAETFTIAVLGSSGLLPPLRKIAEKRQVDSRSVVIRECTKVDEISGAHIVLIAESMEEYLPAIVKKAEAERILTVGSREGLAEKGAAVDFVSTEDRVGFEMNLDAVQRAGLKVSSQLTKLAILVGGDRASEAKGASE
ncbi:MAG TPA: YfiR family protein [Candidatus Hydrogenedentes bacterium]|nr:YfiR family protein [Candidatus Hydrogenedentota bacterium]